MAAGNFSRALDFIAKEIGGEVQVTTLKVFLYIAERGTCQQREVEEGLKLTNATTSRNVSFWTERRFDRAEGLRFVDRVSDDYDRRIRNLSLTPKGRDFYDKLIELDR